jgi:LmbE family N-acetylglucosaminyl deacetylase
MAHPDDPEFTAGGTIASWTAAGVSVQYAIVTDGAKGSADRAMTPERLREVRQHEQRAAAARLGVHDVAFLGFPDGEIAPDLSLRRAIAREIRRSKPEVVVAQDPSSLYWDTFINHPDHRAAGQAALDAVFPTARDWMSAPDLLLVEGLEPHKVDQVWLTGSRAPDVWVDIAPTFERKLSALREHRSQIHDPDGLEARVRARAAAAAEGHGMELAEAFKRIALP